MTYNLFVTAKYKPTGRRAQTSTPSTRYPTRTGSPTGSGRAVSEEDLVRGPNGGAAPDPSKWVVIRQSRRRPSRHHGQGCARRDLVSAVRSRRIFPRGHGVRCHRLQDLLGARLQPGRVVPHDVRPARRRDRCRSLGQAAIGQTHALHLADLHELPRTHCPQRDGTYRVIAGRLVPGRIIGNFLFAGTRPDDPERRRPARAPARAARATRVRRLDESHRPQGREHARCPGHRERSDGGETLPPGRRVDVRDEQRPARMGSGLGALLRGPRHGQTAVVLRLRAESVAEGALRGVPVGRQVRRRPVQSAHMEAADADRRVHGNARRRRVLGRAPGGGVHRAADQSGRAHGRIQRSARPRNISATC